MSNQIQLRYADSAEEIDAVEPLWNALQEHHGRITPELDPQTPKREFADAWRLRRSKYVRWLEDPETFFVVAENESGPVGFMAITTTRASPRTRVCGWRAPDQAGLGRREAE